MTIESLMADRAAMYPGDIVAAADGTAGQTLVYPMGLWHLVHQGEAAAAVFAALERVDPMPSDAEVDAAFPVFTDPPAPGQFGGFVPPSAEVRDAERQAAIVAAVADVLLTLVGLPLLADCTVPALTDPASPTARAVAQSWARQTFPPPEPVDPDDVDADAVERFCYRELLARLVRAGHRLEDVLHARQRGLLGRPLPFPGYTLRQAVLYAGAASRLAAADRAALAVDVNVATAAAFHGGDVAESLERHIARLTSA